MKRKKRNQDENKAHDRKIFSTEYDAIHVPRLGLSRDPFLTILMPTQPVPSLPVKEDYNSMSLPTLDCIMILPHFLVASTNTSDTPFDSAPGTAVVVYQNLELMVIALLAPELIILWAMRQWISARDIAKEFGKYGWGKTHGFFVLMGGFTLYDRDTFRGYIWEEHEKYEANTYLSEIMYYRGELQKAFDDADSLYGDAKTRPVF
ncbi:hypothetical protein MPER_07599, partial [Moniliophthora perniciosa FA553]